MYHSSFCICSIKKSDFEIYLMVEDAIVKENTLIP